MRGVSQITKWRMGEQMKYYFFRFVNFVLPFLPSLVDSIHVLLQVLELVVAVQEHLGHHLVTLWGWR